MSPLQFLSSALADEANMLSEFFGNSCSDRLAKVCNRGLTLRLSSSYMPHGAPLLGHKRVSFGDQNRAYLRGQLTVHKNIPRVNEVWRHCPHLSKFMQRIEVTYNVNKRCCVVFVDVRNGRLPSSRSPALIVSAFYNRCQFFFPEIQSTYWHFCCRCWK